MFEDHVKKVSQLLLHYNYRLVTAESCTGGMVAAAMTEFAGSSQWFERGFVTYSNAAKQELLGVSDNTLELYGEVSEETAREMVAGALKHSHADVGVAVTGIAGPSGGSDEKPVGMVCFACQLPDCEISSTTQIFLGTRDQIRQQAVQYVLKQLSLKLSI